MSSTLTQTRATRFLQVIAAVAAGWMAFAGCSARAELIGYYDFNSAASPLTDLSGKGNHICGNGGTNPVWGTTTGFESTGAFDFSGDRLVVPVNVNASAMPKMTWGAWVRTDTLSSSLYKVLRQDNGSWDRV